MRKSSQNGFVGVVLGIIVALSLIAGGTYVYVENKEPAPPSQEANTVPAKTSESVETQTPIKEASKQGSIASTTSAGMCGLKISSPLPHEEFTWPLVITGTVNMKPSPDCTWQTFEGVAGTAQFHIYLTEKDGNGKMKGWTSIGNPVIMNLEKVSAEKAHFTVTFNFNEGGFEMNAPVKIIFTEENPAVTRPSLTLELPLVFK